MSMYVYIKALQLKTPNCAAKILMINYHLMNMYEGTEQQRQYQYHRDSE